MFRPYFLDDFHAGILSLSHVIITTVFSTMLYWKSQTNRHFEVGDRWFRLEMIFSLAHISHSFGWIRTLPPNWATLIWGGGFSLLNGYWTGQRRLFHHHTHLDQHSSPKYQAQLHWTHTHTLKPPQISLKPTTTLTPPNPLKKRRVHWLRGVKLLCTRLTEKTHPHSTSTVDLYGNPLSWIARCPMFSYATVCWRRCQPVDVFLLPFQMVSEKWKDVEHFIF